MQKPFEWNCSKWCSIRTVFFECDLNWCWIDGLKLNLHHSSLPFSASNLLLSMKATVCTIVRIKWFQNGMAIPGWSKGAIRVRSDMPLVYFLKKCLSFSSNISKKDAFIILLFYRAALLELFMTVRFRFRLFFFVKFFNLVLY